MKLKFGPVIAPMVAKKLGQDFFKILIFFKMASVFVRKMAKIANFCRKMAVILKKMKILKNLAPVFCHHGGYIWSKFQLHSPFLAKLVSTNLILRYRDFKSSRDSFFEKSAQFCPIFSKILKIFQFLWFFMV